ncbi:beta-propeller domain-containing protein [Rossellomorea sp. YZS02]|uniref:beta-propeller domain-containing protein n=1 Tax=Rossellomorea sp. YZS02 TaxID=3097358 RepID=UPI002A0BB1A4|nr:beta-propeller domain-containing protein [Rossellomorea sp. YZS02]MDX8345095.1 beta-propeller domain-containing protein [Rossellomorea sp. YZS02]
MSKKTYLLIVLGVVLLVGIGTFLYTQRPVVKAEGRWAEDLLIMENDSWKLQFSTPLKKDTVTAENIYVKDSDGRDVNVTLKLSEDRKSLQVHAPNEGYPLEPLSFTLHISPNVKTKWGLSYSGDTEIPFAVTSQLPGIQSREALAEYFKKVLKRNKENTRFSLFGREEKMESKSSEDSASGESSQAGSDFSTTNNQVQGVDEGDLVKTDGGYIYQLTDRRLLITKVKPRMEVVSTIIFKEHVQPHHLFLNGDKVLVIGNNWSPPFKEGDQGTRSKIMPVEGMTVAFLYDVSNKDKPSLQRKVELEGQYHSSRKMDSTVYLISSMYPNYWMLEQDDELDVRPRVRDSLKDGESEPIPYENIRYFPKSTSPNYTLMTALDMENPKAPLTVDSYLGGGDAVYMTKENLYIAAEQYEEDGWASPDTDIYKFRVEDGEITFTSSGRVEGRVLNQFSMDEHRGYFRIATTDGEAWNNDSPSSNALYILDENMKNVGEVTDLARGEKIYSVRFMGDKAYIVTFKQVDPLFVIDTEDPTDPKVLGELKIPGFSTYLHPIDDRHLIGFGYDTKVVNDGKEANIEPRITRKGMKISLFDITDFHHPKVTDTEIIGGAGTHSTLLEDHKALLHEPSRNLYGFPISVYNEKEGSQHELDFDYQGALLYEITPEKGIVLKSKLAEEGNRDKEYYEQWEDQIQRLIYIDDLLYTVSNRSITSYSMDGFNNIDTVDLN